MIAGLPQKYTKSSLTMWIVIPRVAEFFVKVYYSAILFVIGFFNLDGLAEFLA